jgi:hypothetical protein
MLAEFQSALTGSKSSNVSLKFADADAVVVSDKPAWNGRQKRTRM